MRKTGLNTIYEIAKKDKDIVFIGSDLGPGTLENFKNEMPNQFLMEGISESHVLGMAAGMAMEGHRVYVNTIASFLYRRSFEQLCLDICFENLNVTLYANGGGLVYGPLGHSHTAVDDFSVLASMPNLTILAPADANEMNSYIKQSASHQGPIYIRLGKGGDPLVTQQKEITIGKAIFYPAKVENKTLILTTGIMLQRSLEVQKIISSDVMHFGTVQPFDKFALLENIDKYDNIIVLEEHVSTGGLGTRVATILFENKITPKLYKHYNLGNKYINIYGRQEEIFEELKLTPKAIANELSKLIP